MNATKVKEELARLYPNKSVFEGYTDAVTTEIICEIEPTSLHSDYSIAIAVIDKSKKHYHKFTEETYKIIKGELTLYVDDELIELKEGDTYTIQPGKVHWAEGNETWIECTSYPGWTFEDHIEV